MNDESNSETAAIEAVVLDYFLGMYEADGERLRRVFHPKCWLFGENRNGCHGFPVEGFIEQIASAPAPRTEGEPFEMSTLSIDRTGSVATAKLAVRYQNRRYTDYLTLQKADGVWRVVGKLFFTQD